MQKTKPIRRFSLAMPDKLYEKLRKEAFRKKESVAKTIRRLINDGLSAAG